MRVKRPTNSIVYYSLKFIEKSKSLSGFDQYLLRYPGLSKREKNPWRAIQVLIDELNGALPEVRLKFDSHLNEILTFYFQLCCDQRSTYLAIKTAPMITAQVIFRLRKCFPPKSKRVLSPHLINELLALISLQCVSADARALCNALLGAGYLAMDGQLEGEVSASVVNKFLLSLVDISAAADPKYLCNVILGLGLLADKTLLRANVSASLLNQILKALLDKSSALECWHIGNTLLGIGYLVKQGCLEGEINRAMVWTLMNELARKRAPNRSADIANALHGAGYFAMRCCSPADVEWRQVKMLFNTVIDKGAVRRPVDLCKAMLGISHLSQRCTLPIDGEGLDLTDAWIELADKAEDIDARDLSAAVLGSGILAQQCCLSRKIDVRLVHQVLSKVYYQDSLLNAEHLCRFLTGIGFLARQGCLEGLVEVRSIHSLLSALVEPRSVVRSVDLCNALLVVTDLALVNRLQGKVEGEIINQLLSTFLGMRLEDPASLCFSLQAVTCLANLGRLENRLNAVLINTTLALLIEHRVSLASAQLSYVLSGLEHTLRSGFVDGTVDIKLMVTLMASFPVKEGRILAAEELAFLNTLMQAKMGEPVSENSSPPQVTKEPIINPVDNDVVNSVQQQESLLVASVPALEAVVQQEKPTPHVQGEAANFSTDPSPTESLVLRKKNSAKKSKKVLGKHAGLAFFDGSKIEHPKQKNKCCGSETLRWFFKEKCGF